MKIKNAPSERISPNFAVYWETKVSTLKALLKYFSSIKNTNAFFFFALDGKTNPIA